MANSTGIQVYIGATTADLMKGLQAASDAVRGSARQMSDAMGGVAPASRALGESLRAGGTHAKSFEDHARELRREIIQGDRTINFFADTLNAFVPKTSLAGEGLRSITDAIVGGVGLSFGIQLAMTAVSLLGEAFKEAAEEEKKLREEAEKHASAMEKVRKSAEDFAFSQGKPTSGEQWLKQQRDDVEARAAPARKDLADATSALADAQARLAGAQLDPENIAAISNADAAVREAAQRLEEARRAAGAFADELKNIGTEFKGVVAAEEGTARREALLEAQKSAEQDAADERKQYWRDLERVQSFELEVQKLVAENNRAFAEAGRQALAGANQWAQKVAPGASGPLWNQKIMQEGDAEALQSLEQTQAEARKHGEAIANAISGPMVSTFRQGLEVMLQGQLTFTNAIRGLWQMVLDMVVNVITTMVSTWITSAITGMIIGKTKAASQVTANAAIAGSGAAASQASIPYIGPALALAAMTETTASVLGAMLPLASAAGGYDIPSGMNPLVQAHAEEMILPAKYANAIRDMTGGGAGGNVTIQISATDARSFKAYLRDHRGELVSVIREAVREGRAVGV